MLITCFNVKVIYIYKFFQKNYLVPFFFNLRFPFLINLFVCVTHVFYNTSLIYLFVFFSFSGNPCDFIITIIIIIKKKTKNHYYYYFFYTSFIFQKKMRFLTIHFTFLLTKKKEKIYFLFL